MSNDKSDSSPSLEEAIDELFSTLKTLDAETDQYVKCAEQLTKLYDIQAKKAPDRFSKDQILGVAGNLAGMLLILNFEKLGPISSKAIGFIRPRA